MVSSKATSAQQQRLWLKRVTVEANSTDTSALAGGPKAARLLNQSKHRQTIGALRDELVIEGDQNLPAETVAMREKEEVRGC